jgi:hypothetical protein
MTRIITENLLLVGFPVYWFIYFYFGYRFKKRVGAFFTKHQDDSAALTIEEWRISINRDYPLLFFSPGRTATLLFRDHRIFLVYGKVGVAGVVKAAWVTKKCLYAFASVEEAEWMRKNSDVFELAYSGTICSVYWVEMSKLAPV